MQKTRSLKIRAVLIGLAAVAAVILFAVVFLFQKTDSYRSILIYQLKGTAEIEREGDRTIRAAENIYLESGDRTTVGEESSMRLKLDSDKYVMVEGNSIFSIKAAGSETDSETTIELEQGAITNEIQNKLNENSTYEIDSPNSIMAVRGTIFRVEGYVDETGKICTKVSTFGGKVAFQPKSPDGTLGEEIMIEAGKEVIVGSDSEGVVYLKELSDIDYSDLSLQTLSYLQELAENGTSFPGISQDDLQALIQKQEDSETYDEEDDYIEDAPLDEDMDDSDTDNSGVGEGAEEQTPQTPQSRNIRNLSPTLQTPQAQTPQEYTVTFLYQGQLFATQTVKSGQKAQEPELSPAGLGKWDFDFSQTISDDTVITWIP